MGEVTYRRLDLGEALRFEEIDRTEVIDHIYYLREGQLVLEEEHWELRGWLVNELPSKRAHLEECMEEDGAAWGAFDGGRLVGIAVLDGRWYGDSGDTLDMYFLHVSDGYRHHGIGRRLTDLAKARAREMGARRLFVSGLPSLNTIRFYRAMGFDLTTDADPRLVAREPDDIHMELTL
jgi:ribosomal protein S18 acetylase RimI-like enzyme